MKETALLSAKKKRGPTLSYYEYLGPDKAETQCKLCDKKFSVDAIKEIKEHIVDDHGETPTDYESEKKPKVLFRGRYWDYFTKKEGYVATCNICANDYSFRSTVSNLKKHLIKKHGVDVIASLGDSDSEVEKETPSNKKKRGPTWNYFEVLDSDKFEAQCKICEKSIAYDTVDDLKKHIEQHGEDPVDSDDEVKVHETRHVSKIWKYFKKLDMEKKLALCLICKNVYNAETTNNLKKHLNAKHPGADVPEVDEKKYIISSDGQLYEMESETEKGDDNDDAEDKDPIEMDTVYLEDLDDLDISRHSSPSPSPPKKKAKSIFNKRQSISKPRKEQLLNNSSNNEINEAPPRRNSYNTSLDYFGQYVVSLLKELPKSVSTQLQNEIIKQILTSKVALESEGTKCQVSINQNTDNQTNVTEPIMYIEAKPNT
ncbi:uncharacterized protein LOC111351293 isoform X2 [Spodoptera litura]|uniref:Uncharacterized protein LOC111351293 isoform X2 n=1 Tax=Spodoptera litura TaxID=69820 RepID=A0A9J7DY00_SPOLT|nr:uncharacterized protein LOC111351293 isoform X2 [Spodoptera litura]